MYVDVCRLFVQTFFHIHRRFSIFIDIFLDSLTFFWVLQVAFCLSKQGLKKVGWSTEYDVVEVI